MQPTGIGIESSRSPALYSAAEVLKTLPKVPMAIASSPKTAKYSHPAPLSVMGPQAENAK